MSEGVHHFFSQKSDESPQSSWRKGTRGYYKVAFIESLHRVSEKDVQIRKSYAKDYLSHYLDVSKHLIQLEQKRDTQGLTMRGETYYVIIGRWVVGKISVNIQRSFTWTNMVFVFQVKKTGRDHKHNLFHNTGTAEYARMVMRKHLHDERKRTD